MERRVRPPYGCLVILFCIGFVFLGFIFASVDWDARRAEQVDLVLDDVVFSFKHYPNQGLFDNRPARDVYVMYQEKKYKLNNDSKRMAYELRDLTLLRDGQSINQLAINMSQTSQQDQISINYSNFILDLNTMIPVSIENPVNKILSLYKPQPHLDQFGIRVETKEGVFWLVGSSEEKLLENVQIPRINFLLMDGQVVAKVFVGIVSTVDLLVKYEFKEGTYQVKKIEIER